MACGRAVTGAIGRTVEERTFAGGETAGAHRDQYWQTAHDWESRLVYCQQNGLPTLIQQGATNSAFMEPSRTSPPGSAV